MLVLSARVYAHKYIICVIRTLRSIIIQVDGLAINEQLLSLSDKYYVHDIRGPIYAMERVKAIKTTLIDFKKGNYLTILIIFHKHNAIS